MSPCGPVPQRMLREGLYGWQSREERSEDGRPWTDTLWPPRRGRRAAGPPGLCCPCPYLLGGLSWINQAVQASRSPAATPSFKVPLPFWVTDVAVCSAPNPTLRFSILKLLQLQREFALSLEDTKTWNKQSLIINALFLAGIKSSPGIFKSEPGHLGDPAQSRMLTGSGGRELGEFGSGASRPFLEEAQTLPSRGRQSGKRPNSGLPGAEWQEHASCFPQQSSSQRQLGPAWGRLQLDAGGSLCH